MSPLRQAPANNEKERADLVKQLVERGFDIDDPQIALFHGTGVAALEWAVKKGSIPGTTNVWRPRREENLPRGELFCTLPPTFMPEGWLQRVAGTESAQKSYEDVLGYAKGNAQNLEFLRLLGISSSARLEEHVADVLASSNSGKMQMLHDGEPEMQKLVKEFGYDNVVNAIQGSGKFSGIVLALKSSAFVHAVGDTIPRENAVMLQTGRKGLALKHILGIRVFTEIERERLFAL